MDTILVVNAGSSSVKFQIFTVEGEGGLRRQIKGQMDGIGSRPRLRASGSTGEPLDSEARLVILVGYCAGFRYRTFRSNAAIVTFPP